MTSTTPFRHTPLTLSSSSIRLVQIHPVPPGTTSTLSKPHPISIRISQFTTASRPPYLGVSYTWGTPTSPSTTTSNNPPTQQCITINSRPFVIQPNLHSLLLHLRQRNERRFLWVDALCIDQRNLEERNFHVQLMARIYGEAVAGLVWLRNPSAGRWEARAMEFVEEMAKSAVEMGLGRAGRGEAGGWERVYLAGNMMRRWENLVRFCTEVRYWSRTWILQEFLQAKEVEVLCGLASLDWRKFEAVFEKVKRLESVSLPVPVQMVEVLEAFMSSVPARLTARRLSGQASKLETLLHEFYDAECSEPRDKVYGMLGISADCGELQEADLQGVTQFRGPQPDYGKHIVEVYFDVLSYLRDESSLRCVTPLTAFLLQKSLYITELAIAEYVKKIEPSVLQMKLTAVSFDLKPDYISIISDTIADWKSAYELKQRLQRLDWASYVGWEIQRTQSRNLSQPQSSLLRRVSSGPKVVSGLPQDLIDRAVTAADSPLDLLHLYNYPGAEGAHLPLQLLKEGHEDKRLMDNPTLRKPTLIVEQSEAVYPVRLGFACTRVRRGDFVCQWKGLDVTLITRRTPAHDLKLIGKASMVKHVDLQGKESAVHPACGRPAWSSACPQRPAGIEEEALTVESDPLSLFEVLRDG